MSESRGRPAVGKGNGTKSGTQKGSRRHTLDHLRIGESAFFVGEQGQQAGRLMANIASIYRDGECISQQGLTQSAGVAIFDGEYSRPVVKVTRLRHPE